MVAEGWAVEPGGTGGQLLCLCWGGRQSSRLEHKEQEKHWRSQVWRNAEMQDLQGEMEEIQSGGKQRQKDVPPKPHVAHMRL